MYIEQTNSTNTLLKELIANGQWPETEKFIYAGYQTGGRGQAGNTWESEPKKNLLCSILLPPHKEPFFLNVLVSVAVCLTAKAVLQHSGPIAKRSYSEAISIKWPNDIYWQDCKIAGILIENAIIGSEIKYSIAGIGLNVNQTEWQSDAPNPISMKQISGVDYPLDQIMSGLMDALQDVQKWSREEIWQYYKNHLYRREGFWPFVEREVNTLPTMNAKASVNGQFLAHITDILPTGEIVLETTQGQQRKYHFKQIRYVL